MTVIYTVVLKFGFEFMKVFKIIYFALRLFCCSLVFIFYLISNENKENLEIVFNSV